MVQVRISSEGGDHTFNVDVPFTADKVRELIRGRTNIPEESQSLFDYSEKRETEFELIGTRVFVANTPQHFVLTMGEFSQWAYFYVILPPYATVKKGVFLRQGVNITRVYQRMNCHKLATVKDLMNMIADFNKLCACEFWLYKENKESKLADINQNLFEAAVVNGCRLYVIPCDAQCKESQLPQGAQVVPQLPQGSQMPKLPQRLQVSQLTQGAQMPQFPQGSQVPQIPQRPQMPQFTQGLQVPQGSQMLQGLQLPQRSQKPKRPQSPQ